MMNHMKFSKLILWLVIGFITIAVGCGEDEDTLNTSLVGNWVATGISVSQCTNAADSTSALTCDNNDCQRLILIDTGGFQAVTITDGLPSRVTGTWTSTDTRLSLCVDVEDEQVCDDYTYLLTGTDLILTFQNPDNGCLEEVTYQPE
jgi:hypothetical protein